MSYPKTRKTRPESDRFWEKVSKTDFCWMWMGATTARGYGRFYFRGSVRPAHQWSYIDQYGEIPEGLELDHLCRNPRCVNPSHLEPVDHRTNSLRSDSPTAINARKTECVNGHPFDQANTYIHRSGKRACRACNRANVARIKAKKRDLCGMFSTRALRGDDA